MSGTSIIVPKSPRIPKVTGQYLQNVFGGGTAVLTQSELRLAPVLLEQDIPIDRICVEVTSLAASSFVRPVIYRSNTSGRPGALLVDGGQIDSSSNGKKEATVAATIPSGLTWWGCVAQGGAPTVRTSASFAATASPIPMDFDSTLNFVFPAQATVTGAPPDPFVRSTVTQFAIAIRVRIA